MIINVGSQNKVKIEAVTEVFSEFDQFKNLEVVSLDVPSSVSVQPCSLEETIAGARNRATAAFKEGCRYSIGLEAGIMPLPENNRYVNITVCVVYTGNDYAIGLSSAFEIPPKMISLIIHEEMDLDQATKAIGLTERERIGREEGTIGLLTQGKMTRKEYIKAAIITALVSILNPDFYREK